MLHVVQCVEGGSSYSISNYAFLSASDRWAIAYKILMFEGVVVRWSGGASIGLSANNSAYLSMCFSEKFVLEAELWC